MIWDEPLAPSTVFRGLVEEWDGVREESDEELRARLLNRAPRSFDEFELWAVVLGEASRLARPPRSLTARRWGACNYFVMAECDGASRSELAERIRDNVPAWVSVSVVAP